MQDVASGGRAVVFVVNGEQQSAEISSGRTTITIAGEKAERAALKPGMTCDISYPGDKQEAAAIACR